MKVLLLTETYFPKINGNAICTERIATGLKNQGLEVLIKTVDNIDLDTAIEFNPDIIHAMNAYRSRVALPMSEELQVPFVVTMTGSDYLSCIGENSKELLKGRSKEAWEVIKKSGGLAVYNEPTRDFILEKLHGLEEKLQAIPKGEPIIGINGYSLNHNEGISKDDFVITLIANIRPEKNNLFPIRPLEELRDRYKDIKLVFVGGIFDKEYHEEFLKEINGKEWIHYIGPVQFDKIKAIHCDSDLLLNCSRYEGESNVLIEGLYCGRPLLVSDAEGNTALIKDGVNGYTYKRGDQQDFFNKVKSLYENQDRLRQISKGAKKSSFEVINFDEGKQYLELYQKAIANHNSHQTMLIPYSSSPQELKIVLPN